MILPKNINSIKESGIYLISSTINNKVYVGSAVNIYTRAKRHEYVLNNNKHHNLKLQRFYTKYGINSLEFKVIEICSKENLLNREQYYLDKYNPTKEGFNILSHARNSLGLKHSEQSKLKMRVSALNIHKNKSNKLTIEDVIVIKQMLFLGYSCGVINRVFKVDRRTIQFIKHRKTWSNVELIIPDKERINEIIDNYGNIINLHNKKVVEYEC